MRRRSRLVGRPLIAAAGLAASLRSFTCAWRRASSAYSACATGAGPRCIASARTVIVHSKSPTWRCNRSPDLTSRAGLTRSPFSFTRPCSMAWVARLRVLKKRATHSHLSSRMVTSGVFSAGIERLRRDQQDSPATGWLASIVPAMLKGNHLFTAPFEPRYNDQFFSPGVSMPKILAFSGSIRRDSWNRKLIQAAADAPRAAGGNVTQIDLADYPLPLYNGDHEDRYGLPDNVQRMKALFKNHDAFLIAGPEYNGSIAPMIKNTLDWVSCEWQGESGRVPYQNKIAALLSASSETFGGIRMLPHLRQVLSTLGVLVLPSQFSLAHADKAFDEENGALKSPAQLHAMVLELVRITKTLASSAG